MNKILTLCLLSMAFITCSKEKLPATPGIKNVTGFSWQLFNLQKTTDPFLNPIPTFWYMKLNDDRTFNFTLHNSVSSGTYSWVQIDSSKARVSFTIQSWNASPSDTQYTNKLKVILQNVDTCLLIKPPYLLPMPGNLGPISMQLQFKSSHGYFNVFRY